ncbi:hypothetical protein GJ25_gp104 [Mycobacterium phage Hawkeye]|uniref:Uncharacterized protein n=1 Tax=Mycobacterium phage Hawkeye TaxID=1458711 RepID=X2KT71_9CAUD|nr:hypothetical protein GJ25_gp104 [Mycobacterium phage Hawkeye]AHN84115.1 hypothetical protein PBI_HAWKEYE_104 [Mycobacterium phage Hawkeye]
MGEFIDVEECKVGFEFGNRVCITLENFGPQGEIKRFEIPLDTPMFAIMAAEVLLESARKSLQDGLTYLEPMAWPAELLLDSEE